MQKEGSKEPDTAGHWLRIGQGLGDVNAGPHIAGSTAAFALPQVVANLVADKVAGIVEFVSSADNGNHFANNLEQVFGDLGILQAGWRPKAEEAFDSGNG